jgi:hypothetical protein
VVVRRFRPTHPYRFPSACASIRAYPWLKLSSTFLLAAPGFPEVRVFHQSSRRLPMSAQENSPHLAPKFETLARPRYNRGHA